MKIAALAAVLAAAACTSSTPDVAPTLVITSPERGATSDAGMVTVTGTVTGATHVTVNGSDATVAKDGTFSTQVAVGTGITILETHALAGTNDIRDVRAVLAGELVASDGKTTAPIAARAGKPALAAIGNAMATQAEALDFNTLVKAMNPVYNNTGCLGAKVDVTSVALSTIDIGLAPGTGALVADVAINDVVVHAHADFKAACIGGSTNITVTVSKARIHGDLAVAVVGAKLTTTLPDATVALDGFTIDVGGVPSAVESLLKNKVRDAVANALTNVIKDKAPAMANSALSGLLAKPLATTILGKKTTIAIAPGELDITPDAGLYVALDTSMTVEGGEGGVYATTHATASPDVLANMQGLGVAVANDAVNQLFSGMWAAGAMDRTLDIGSVGPLAALLDPTIATLDVHLALPPTVSTAGDSLQLAIGDLIVTGKDASGAEIQKIALSFSTTLTAGPTQSGKLALVVGTPTVKAQVVAQADTVSSPLTDKSIEGIVTGAWGLVGDLVDSALAKVPMPSIAGVQLGAPAMSGKAGFLVADIGVQ